MTETLRKKYNNKYNNLPINIKRICAIEFLFDNINYLLREKERLKKRYNQSIKEINSHIKNIEDHIKRRDADD